MVLSFHKLLSAELLEEDGLVVMGSGLGLEGIVERFIKAYSSSHSIVLAINIPTVLQEQYRQNLAFQGVQTLPRIINNETTSSDRTQLYLQGGVLFISPWILVLDLLRKRIPTHLVSGILVFNAHRLEEFCTEDFILKLYRQSNKTGFIKAFSDDAPALVREFGQVERLMRMLYVKKLYLWPRYVSRYFAVIARIIEMVLTSGREYRPRMCSFHQRVIESLQHHQPEVIELHQPLSPLMTGIQECITEIMQACLNELKGSNQMDISALEVEGGLFRDFEHVIRTQLDSCWHTVGQKSKQLLADLRNLRKLLLLLVKYDCVTYNRFLENLRVAEFNHRSVWLFMDAGSRLFRLAKRRVFSLKKKPPPVASATAADARAINVDDTTRSNSQPAVSSLGDIELLIPEISDPATTTTTTTTTTPTLVVDTAASLSTEPTSIVDTSLDDPSPKRRRLEASQHHTDSSITVSTINDATNDTASADAFESVTTTTTPRATVDNEALQVDDGTGNNSHDRKDESQRNDEELEEDDDATQPHTIEEYQQELDELSQARSETSLLSTPSSAQPPAAGTVSKQALADEPSVIHRSPSPEPSPKRSSPKRTSPKRSRSQLDSPAEATATAAATTTTTAIDVDQPSTDATDEYELNLEENPKWTLLLEVLDEIERENGPTGTTEPGRILIAVRDERTCRQVQEYLSLGGKTMLMRLWTQYLATRQKAREQGLAAAAAAAAAEASVAAVPSGIPSRRGRGGSFKRGSTATRGGSSSSSSSSYHAKQKARAQNRYLATATTASDLLGKRAAPGSTIAISSPSPRSTPSPASSQAPLQEAYGLDVIHELGPHFDQYFGLLLPPTIVVHPITSGQLLDEMQPKFVIVYDPDIRFIRQLEIYKAETPGKPLRVYFLSYEKSVEEQYYVASLRKENEAFERLIREKALLVVSAEQDGKSTIESVPGVWSHSPDTPSTSTRKGGKPTLRIPTAMGTASSSSSNNNSKSVVVVDVREFRSQLPCALFSRGLEVVPKTLEVADYILTPDICVERKSLSDLFSSFQSGRLYTQVEAMCKGWKTPILLIEFDPKRSFAMQARNQLGSEIQPQNIISKLSLLTLHFPALRLIWSRSPHATVEIFLELKQGMPEPDADVLAAEQQALELSTAPRELLRRLPGINDQNYHVVIDKVGNLRELACMSLAALQQLLGAQSGKQLHRFLHSVSEEATADSIFD